MDQQDAPSTVSCGHKCDAPPAGFTLRAENLQDLFESDTAESLPPLRFLPPSRRRHGQNLTCIENLSLRFGQQNLNWQHDSVNASEPHLSSYSLSSSSTWRDDSDKANLGASLINTGLPRDCCSQLRDTIAEVAEINFDPSLPARVLQDLRAHNIIPVDRGGADSAPGSLEVDEKYNETHGLGNVVACSSEAGLSGVMKRQGLLQFNTSAEAALRCRDVVRNVPRLRRRKTKKREHRIRTAARAPGNGSQSIQTASDFTCQ